MAVDARLLEILACPACLGGVTLADDGSSVACSACGRSYPVRDDMPLMLIEEAAPPKEGTER